MGQSLGEPVVETGTGQPISDQRRPTAIGWGTVVLLWMSVAIVFVLQNIISGITAGQPIHWRSAVWFEIEYWLVFALLSPMFGAVARRYRFEPGHRAHSLVAHASAAILVAMIQPLAARSLNLLTIAAAPLAGDGGPLRLPGALFRNYPLLVVIALWKYAVIVGVYYAFDYYRQFRDQQLQNVGLEGELATAQLRALQTQLHPHFLFNVLNSAAMLTLSDPPRSHLVLTQFAHLLRTTLDPAAPLRIQLVDELEFLDRYLELEAIRFEDRLRHQFLITEEAGTSWVPTLILQPLVENALRHGIPPDGGPRSVTIRARCGRDNLTLEVEDRGPGLPTAWHFASDAGAGLRNVQRRVDAANGRPVPLGFLTPPDGGLIVRMALPRRS
jgi:two-component system, LytTR family, sensor kinase